MVSGIKPIASDVEASSLSSFSSSIGSPFSPSWSKGEFMLDWTETSCESRLKLLTVGVSNSTSLIFVCAVSTSTEFSRCIDCEICQSARRSATSLISIPSNLMQISPRWRLGSDSIVNWSWRVSIIGAMTAQSSGCMKTWPAATCLPAASAKDSIRATINSGNSSIAVPVRAAASLITAACNDLDKAPVSTVCGFAKPIKAVSKALILSVNFASNSASMVVRSSAAAASRPAAIPSPYPRS